MIRDRKPKPAPWNWHPRRVAKDCRWALPGLIVGWPFWQKGNHQFITTTDRRVTTSPLNTNHGDLDSDAGSPFTSPLLSTNWSRRGSVIETPGAAAAGAMLAVTTSMVDFPTGPMTLVFTYRVLSGTIDSGVLGNRHVLTLHASAFEIVLPWTSQGWSIGMDYGGVGGGVNRITASGLTLGDDVWVLTVGLRGTEIWQNGIKVASTANNPTRSNVVTHKWGLWPGYAHLVGNNPGQCGSLLLYDRQMSESEISALSLDPWTPFRQEFRRSGVLSISAFPVQFEGLKIFYGTVVNDLCLVAEADAPTGMGGVLKIDKNGTIYAAYLVETSDPNASSVRVRTSTGTKAIRLKT